MGRWERNKRQKPDVEERYVTLHQCRGGLLERSELMAMELTVWLIDPRKYKRRPGGTLRKAKAG